MSESSDGHVVYVNLYKLSWPIEGPVDGQIMRGYAAYSLGGQNYGPARWDGPSPQWNVYSQQIASCDCPPNKAYYRWDEQDRVRPHANAHTKVDGSTCEAGSVWLTTESGLSGNAIEPMSEEHLESLVSAYGDWIPPYNGEGSLYETPLREGYYLVIEDREAQDATFYERGYERRL